MELKIYFTNIIKDNHQMGSVRRSLNVMFSDKINICFYIV